MPPTRQQCGRYRITVERCPLFFVGPERKHRDGGQDGTTTDFQQEAGHCSFGTAPCFVVGWETKFGMVVLHDNMKPRPKTWGLAVLYYFRTMFGLEEFVYHVFGNFGGYTLTDSQFSNAREIDWLSVFSDCHEKRPSALSFSSPRTSMAHS